MIQTQFNKNNSNSQQKAFTQIYGQPEQAFSILLDFQWKQVKDTIKNNLQIQLKGNLLAQEQIMIQQQTQIISDVIEQINKRKARQSFTSMDVLAIQSSFSNISAVYNNQTDDSFFKSKFTQQFQRSLVNSVLKQVEQQCSSETYESVKNYILSNKQKQYENSLQLVKKLTQQKEELRASLIIKSNQLSHSEAKLNVANSKLQFIQEQKKKIKVKNDKLMEKQKRTHKAEMSLVFKQKISLQGKKRYQREKSLFLSIQERLKKLYGEMNNIWELICNKMEISQNIGCVQLCQDGKNGDCWKKQVMRKCKTQLMDQRNLLKEQEAQIQKQYDMIHALSQQMSKMANDQQFSGGNSQPSVLSVFQQK